MLVFTFLLLLSLVNAHPLSDASSQNCFTQDQKNQLRDSSRGLKITFAAAQIGLTIGAVSVQNVTIAEQLTKAGQVMGDLKDKFFTKLTDISRKDCAKCTDVTDAAGSAVSIIMDGMGNISKEWKEDKYFKTIDSMIPLITDLITMSCPDEHESNLEKSMVPPSFTLSDAQANGCLSSSMVSVIDHSVKYIKKSLHLVQLGFVVARIDGHMDHILDVASKAVQVTSESIVSQVGDLTKSFCPTCSRLTKILSTSVEILKNSLSQIFPKWKENHLFNALASAIPNISNLATIVCPSARTELKHFALEHHMEPRAITPRLEGACLGPLKHLLVLQFSPINMALGGAQFTLNTAAVFTALTNQKLSKGLKKAADIIGIINHDIIRKLTDIADAPCGSCSDVTAAVTKIPDILVEGLVKIEPDWNTNPHFNAFRDGINNMNKFIRNVCPDNTNTMMLPSPTVLTFKKFPRCLSKTQKKDLLIAKDSLKATLFVARSGLIIAPLVIKNNDKLVKQLQAAAKVLGKLDTDFIDKLGEIAQNDCASCSDIVSAVETGSKTIVQGMGKINPKWETNKYFKTVKASIPFLFMVVNMVCPNKNLQTSLVPPSSFTALKESCLSSAQKSQIHTSVTVLDSTLMSAKMILMFASLGAQGDEKEVMGKISTALGSIQSNMVPKIKEVSEKACGSCSDITDAVNTSVEAFTKSLGEIMPEWKTNVWYKTVVNIVPTLMSLASTACPTAANDFNGLTEFLKESKHFTYDLDLKAAKLSSNLSSDLSCLPPPAKLVITGAVAPITIALVTSQAGLMTASISTFWNPALSNSLKVAAGLTGAINTQIVNKLPNICSCSDVAAIFASIPTMLSNAIGGIWKNNGWFAPLHAALSTISGLVKGVCPMVGINQMKQSLQMDNYIWPYSTDSPHSTDFPHSTDSPSTMLKSSNGSKTCLPAPFKGMLGEKMKPISDALHAAEISLETAAEATFYKANLSRNLKRASNIIGGLRFEFMDQLYEVSTGPCGNCDDIAKSIVDGAKKINDGLNAIQPDWKSNKWFTPIDVATTTIAGLVSTVCPKSVKAFHLGDGSCGSCYKKLGFLEEQRTQFCKATNTSTRYTVIKAGKCTGKYSPIKNISECSTAARFLQLKDTTAVDDNQPKGVNYDPAFCYFEGGSLKFNGSGKNTGSCSSKDQCLCKESVPAQPNRANLTKCLRARKMEDRTRDLCKRICA